MGGCETSIEPFSEEGAYSIYGYLSPTRNVQFVRIKPLSVPVSKMDAEPLNVTVTLENLEKGSAEVLRDSVITFADANTTVVTHNFWTETPIRPQTKYRLSVEGPEGSVQASTVTPTVRKASATPREGVCWDRFTVVFDGIQDPRRVRAWVEMKLEEAPQPGPWISFRKRNIFRTRSGDVALTFRPSGFFTQLTQNIEISKPDLPNDKNPFCWRTNWCSLLESAQIRVRYLYLGTQWYGDVPEDSLTFDPLESHDVKNGLGFFGSVRRDVQTVSVDLSPYIWTGGSRCNQPPPDSL